ncbi:MAG: hypothetical protein LW693_09165 [Saprospiraceae bacterium]|nr:hypothetical protein [Saprospiraceae bacterium]
MKIQFYIRYNTRFGESLHISLNNQEPVPLSYLNEEFWEVTITVDPGQSPELQWSYIFKDRDGELKTEHGNTGYQTVGVQRKYTVQGKGTLAEAPRGCLSAWSW